MKGGPPTNDVRMSLEPAAPLSLDVFKLVKRAEGPIGKRLIGEWPQTLCGLQLGRMGWQKEQVEAFRKSQITTLVPSCLIHHQQNVLVWSHPLFLCESRERQRKSRGIDCRHEHPTGLSALGLHKAVEIHPLVAWSHHCSDTTAEASPTPGVRWA